MSALVCTRCGNRNAENSRFCSNCGAPLRPGAVLAVYLIAYGIARFLIERLRTDSLYIGPLPAAYWLSWALIAAGVVLLVAVRRPGRWPVVTPRPSSSQSGNASD